MVHSSRLAAKLLAVLAVTTTPALSWEFGTADGQTFWTGVRDIGGDYQLVFFCSQATPGIIQLQLFTPEPGPSNPVSVELSFMTSEGSFGPIAAQASSLESNLTIATTGADLAAMNAAQAIFAEPGEFTLQYYESTWYFPGANRAEAFGAMLDACG